MEFTAKAVCVHFSVKWYYKNDGISCNEKKEKSNSRGIALLIYFNRSLRRYGSFFLTAVGRMSTGRN